MRQSSRGERSTSAGAGDEGSEAEKWAGMSTSMMTDQRQGRRLGLLSESRN